MCVNNKGAPFQTPVTEIAWVYFAFKALYDIC